MKSNVINKKYLPLIFVVIIYAFGFLIRVYKLWSDPPGLYTDAMVGILKAKIQLYGVHSIPFNNISSRTLPAILYDSINGYFLSIFMFGFGSFSARFPFALYSSLMVFPLYGFTAEIAKSKKTGMIASLLWVISPSPFVTARVGNAVYIFPLFIFLVILFLIMRLIRSKNKIGYSILIFSLITVSLYISNISTWNIIPILITLISLFGYLLFSNYRFSKLYKAFAILYVAVVISSILLIIFDSSLLFTTVLKNFSSDQVTPSFFLFERPFYESVPDFFVRLFTFLSPEKMFLITSPFTPIINIHYVLVPFMLPFLMIIFYPAVAFFIISIILKKNWKRYLFILILFLAGFIQPILNISNSVTSLEPAEALFAVPFAIIISSIGLERFLYCTLINKKDRSNDLLEKETDNMYFGITKQHNKRIKKILILIFTVLIIFGGLSTGIFIHTYFTGYSDSLEDNNSSVYYTTYGLEQASNFIMTHNLSTDEIFFQPANGGGINFAKTSQFNYWVYNLHFPSEWFYLYTHGKVSNVNVLRPGTLPSPNVSSALVISQNVSYGQFLKVNGFDAKVLYEHERADGSMGLIIYQITPISGKSFDRYKVFTTIFPENNLTLNNFSLQANSSFSATLAFSVTETILNNRDESIFSSKGDGFNLGIGPACNFPWLRLSNLTNVPFGNLYTKIASNNYNVSHTWLQFAARNPIVQGSVYYLTETYSKGIMSFYLNDTMVGQNYLIRSVVITGLHIQLYGGIKVISANIFNVSLNTGEIYSLYEEST